MKIAIITRHAIANYGSFLQALATQKVIEKLGYSCEIIDYIRNDESVFRQEVTLLSLNSKWNANVFVKIAYLLVRYPESVIRNTVFSNTRKRFLNLSKKYSSLSQIIEKPPEADVFMTGSDQVWGPVGIGVYDSTYCLSFTSEVDKRISYASSFGHSTLSQEHREYFRKWLSRFDYITVREDSAHNILDEIGIENCQVLDPTLLLDLKEWSFFFEDIPVRDYILVYQIHNDPSLGRYALKIAKEKGIKLIRVSASLHQINRGGEFVWLPSFGEFLSYIKNAKYLITDSFHGAAFAINFNIPFIQFLPKNKTGSRISSILNLTGLQNQLIDDENNIELARKDVDFSNSNRILAEKRNESLEILNSIING